MLAFAQKKKISVLVQFRLLAVFACWLTTSPFVKHLGGAINRFHVIYFTSPLFTGSRKLGEIADGFHCSYEKKRSI